MDDIRRTVEEDRGLLKTIQMFTPGFRGYRKREDIRAADSILRLQMADSLILVREGLEESRRMILEEYQTENIDRIASVINKVRTLEGKVRHAEQGYTGFSPAVRIEEEELNMLYEYDTTMIRSIKALDEAQSRLVSLGSEGNEVETAEEIRGIRQQLAQFEKAFEERIPRIAGIYNI